MQGNVLKCLVYYLDWAVEEAAVEPGRVDEKEDESVGCVEAGALVEVVTVAGLEAVGVAVQCEHAGQQGSP